MGIWNVDNTKEFTHVSLCAGYGGIDIGLKRAIGNVRTIAYSEIEAFPVANLVAKMEAGLMDSAPIWSNLKTFPWHEFRDKVDILSGGFPCQPFSAAGKGDGDEDPRHLFPYIVHGIRAARPAIVFLENVEGIVSAKLKGDHWNDPAGTPVLLHVIRELERLGYKATAVPSSASEVGAPHQRNRWFIVGLANSMCKGLERLRECCNEKGWEESTRQLRSCSQVWPSRPGEEQHDWEPKRTMGNPEYNGSHVFEIPGSTQETSNDNTQWAQKTSEPSGTSRPGELQDLCGELGDSGGKEQQGVSQSERRQQDLEIRKPSRNRKAESSMGGNIDGVASGLGDAELYNTCDNRTDELRMLGNGVVPASAEFSFKLGINELLTGSDSE